jgi:hypothetical protein
MIALLFWAFVIWLIAGGGPTYARDAKRNWGSEVRSRADRDGKSSWSWWLLRFFEGADYALRAAWKGWGSHARYAKRKVAEYQQSREKKAHEEPAATVPEPEAESRPEAPEPYRIVKVTSKSGKKLLRPDVQVPDVGVLRRVLDQIDTDPDKEWAVTYPDGTPDPDYQPRTPPEPPNGGGSPPPADPDSQPDRTVVPIRPDNATATNERDTVTVTGDATGYEQILAGYESNIEMLEQVDAGYEAQIVMLRNLKADDDTIGDVAAMREANENQLAAARETRDNWVSKHGSVYDMKVATGAEGDQALYA